MMCNEEMIYRCTNKAYDKPLTFDVYKCIECEGESVRKSVSAYKKNQDNHE